MRCIITRYMSPTNARGPRFRATWDGPDGLQTLDVSFNHGMSIGEQHGRVATMAAEGLRMALVASAPLPGNKGWAHIAKEA